MKYNDFRKAIKNPYFSWQDIKLAGLNVLKYQISLWRKKGNIERLKRGFYVFSDEREKVSPQRISFLLYEPGYISLESALSHYGLIPEIVYAITAVTAKTTRKFSNAYGSFIYRHIRPDLFFGYIILENENGKYLLAEPEKAILDYFYLNLSKLNNQDDIDELRINYAELRKIINKKKLADYLAEYRVKKLEKIINILLKKC